MASACRSDASSRRCDNTKQRRHTCASVAHGRATSVDADGGGGCAWVRRPEHRATQGGGRQAVARGWASTQGHAACGGRQRRAGGRSGVGAVPHKAGRRTAGGRGRPACGSVQGRRHDGSERRRPVEIGPRRWRQGMEREIIGFGVGIQ